MKDALILEHKKYISARRASEVTGYTSDYIGQLCRSGKIESKIVGRSWFVLEDSLLKHKEINDQVKTNKKTAKIRRANLSQNIKIEKLKDYHFTSLEKDEISVGKLLLSKQAESFLPKLIKNKVGPKVESETKNFSQFKYEAVESPLIPLLKKKILFDKSKKEGTEVKVNFVPQKFSMRDGRAMANVFTLEKNVFGNYIALVFLIILLLGGGIFIQSRLTSIGFNYKNLEQASISSIPKNIVDSVGRGFNMVVGKISSLFGTTPKTVLTRTLPNSDSIGTAKDIGVSNQDLGFNGIAVTPSTNSAEKDEIIKQRIKDSFSDEVRVNPDQSGTSGIITPVFKKATKDNFIYVLVPVDETKQ